MARETEKHPTSNIQHPTSNIQHPTSNIQSQSRAQRRSLYLDVGSWMFDVRCSQSKMESHTEQIHRVLLLWLELNQAIVRVQSAGGSHLQPRCLPWRNDDAQVREVWHKLTD